MSSTRGQEAHELPIKPPLVRYEDGDGIEHEIYTSPYGYDEAIELVKAEDWEALSRYPPYSDMPPLKPKHANVFEYTEDDTGVKRSLFMPPDEAENARLAHELYLAKDWIALTDQFEEYSDQDRARKEEEEEWSRGVERCARARKEQTKS